MTVGEAVKTEAIEVKCPKCGGGSFKESFKAYECPNPECKLIVWKNMSGRELARDEVAKLLTMTARPICSRALSRKRTNLSPPTSSWKVRR